MKKLTHGLGVLAIGISSAAAFSGCSSTTDPGTTPTTTAGTGGVGATAGAGGTPGASGTVGTSGASGATTTAGATGVGGGTQLVGSAAYTALSGADALPGAPAPGAWTTSICSTCHGANGEGVPPIGPEIRHVPAAYGTWVVRHGRPLPSAMVAFPQTSADPTVAAITDAELTSVLAWLDSLPKPTTGQGLYKDFCGNCHGPVNPTGGAVPVSIKGKPISDIVQKVRMGNGTDQSMRTMYMPPEDTTALTDAELQLIEQFLGATPG